MEFNFDEAFTRISREEIEKKTPELLTMQKRHDEYDENSIIMHTIVTSQSINLLVTKRVLEEYHQFILKKFEESR